MPPARDPITSRKIRFALVGCGRIAGKHPYSWVKIALAILAALIVLMIIALIQDK